MFCTYPCTVLFSKYNCTVLYFIYQCTVLILHTYHCNQFYFADLQHRVPYTSLNWSVNNRPGVAVAVLETPLSLIY